MSAGFELDWVQMLELNTYAAVEGTQEKMDEAIGELKNGKLKVFQGDYTGVNFEDETDVLDLNEGFEENRDSSSPAFRYILEKYVEVLE